MMASRPIELPGASGGGWLRMFTGPGEGMITVLYVQNQNVAREY